MLDTDALLRKTSRRILLAVGVLVAFVVIWGGLVPLQGAIVSVGTVAVDGNVKKVQHQTGGIVGALLVHEGSRVAAGDVVARLDDTQTRANLGVIRSDLLAQRARAARLVAERDDLDVVRLAVANGGDSEEFPRSLIDSERMLFEARRLAREGQRAQFRERVAQIGKEMQGGEMQLQATRQQLAIAVSERQSLEPLRHQGLVQTQRLNVLEREIARNEGLVGETVARIEQARARLRETEVQLAQIDRDRVAEASKDLREVEAKIAELSERRTAGEDQLRRVDIRAPASGVVHEMSAHTVGGVVGPGEPLMLIVPEPDDLIVEARVAPQDIDQIHPMQPARLRFTSFNQRTTPELAGVVFRIGPDTSKDQQTGAASYTVAIRLKHGEAAKLKGAALTPGMQAETFMATGERTALSFLLKPLSDNILKVFAGR